MNVFISLKGTHFVLFRIFFYVITFVTFLTNTDYLNNESTNLVKHYPFPNYNWRFSSKPSSLKEYVLCNKVCI